MEHLDFRFGKHRYLLCDPQITPQGRSTGYGNLLRHVEQALRTAGALGATLFLIRPGRPINAAIYDVDSASVRIIGQSDWRAGALRALWWVSTPVRYGAPLAWAASRAAASTRVFAESGKHWARQRGWRRLDTALDRLGHRCRRRSHSYEKRVTDAWHAVFAEARERARATDSKRHRVRLHLRPGAQTAVDRLAREAGIDSSRPLVLLHVRESGYRQRPALRQQSLDSFRDARLDTYQTAVAWLVDRGYQVVRIGDQTMTPCQWPGVIDLATAPWRTDAFELWAALNSRFFLTGDSGPYFLGQLAGVPCLSVNVFRLGYNTIRPDDRYIGKRVFDRVQGRYLSIGEQLSEEFIRGPFNLDRYEWTDNTADEIRDAVEDMVEFLDNPGSPRTSAQVRHDQLLADLASRSSDWGTAERMLFRRGGPGTMSPRFVAHYLDAGPSPCLEQDPRIR